MKHKICIRSMVLGAGIVLIGLAVGAIVSCGSGDDVTKPNDEGTVITPKTTEPEADKVDKENEPAAVVEPAPQEPEPEPEPLIIGNPRANDPPKPMPVDPEQVPEEKQPEPPQLDERELAEIAEREARSFLKTNRDRIRQRVWDLRRDNLEAHPAPFYDEAYKEELGFGLFFIIEVLLPILEEEKPEEKELGLFISEPFIVEYSILKFQHPDKNEDELLELFRVSAREGNISIIPGEQKPLLNLGQRKVEPNQEGCVPKAWIGNKWLEEFLQAPLPEDPDPNLTNLDKARVLWKRYEQIRKELQEQDPNMDWSVARERAWKEAFGFNKAVWEILFFTYEEEMRYTWPRRSFFFVALILEYVRLSFEFPNEDPEGLLCLFRESVRAGNVLPFVDNPKPWLID